MACWRDGQACAGWGTAHLMLMLHQHATWMCSPPANRLKELREKAVDLTCLVFGSVLGYYFAGLLPPDLQQHPGWLQKQDLTQLCHGPLCQVRGLKCSIGKVGSVNRYGSALGAMPGAILPGICMVQVLHMS